MQKLRTSEFFYELPEKLIAHKPSPIRSDSRLLTLDRSGGKIYHHRFFEVIEYLRKGDCLVINETMVLPVSLSGRKIDSDGRIDVLILNEVDDGCWAALVRPAKRAGVGAVLMFGDDFRCTVSEDAGEGIKILKFDDPESFYKKIDVYGKTPIPPYIKREKSLDEVELRKRYQTVFAKYPGSPAAPTAGLHFTQDLLEKISGKGIKIVRITLHVGVDTFRPIMEEYAEDHRMHSEYYEISAEGADAINQSREKGGRVIAVGTTTTRALETSVRDGDVAASSGWTELFILPGYRFKIVDGLITNFHLPKSTLLMLVCAFAGKDLVFRAYEEAIDKEYRFYSFGDAMLIF